MFSYILILILRESCILPLDELKLCVFCSNSNHDDNLDHHDPGVVSMVILDELPLLVQTLPGECVLSDEVIKTTTAFTQESEIR
jgi:hypothetical protein